MLSANVACKAKTNENEGSGQSTRVIDGMCSSQITAKDTSNDSQTRQSNETNRTIRKKEDNHSLITTNRSIKILKLTGYLQLASWDPQKIARIELEQDGVTAEAD